MCGIAGYAVEEYDPRLTNLAEFLGLLNESRGHDAYGVTDGKQVNKKAIEITKALAKLFGPSGQFRESRQVLIHTRQGTTGAKTKNENAHPFNFGRILGVHNGMISNHMELNKKYSRQFDVDSMHIFAHIEAKLSTEEIDGYGTIVYFDAGVLKFCKINGGQLSIARIPEIKGIAWSSTEGHLESALDAAGFEDRKLLKIEEGQIYFYSEGGLKFFSEEKMKFRCPSIRRGGVVHVSTGIGYSGPNTSPNYEGSSSDEEFEKSWRRSGWPSGSNRGNQALTQYVRRAKLSYRGCFRMVSSQVVWAVCQHEYRCGCSIRLVDHPSIVIFDEPFGYYLENREGPEWIACNHPATTIKEGTFSACKCMPQSLAKNLIAGLPVKTEQIMMS